VKRIRVASGSAPEEGNGEVHLLTPQILPSITLPPMTTSELAPVSRRGRAWRLSPSNLPGTETTFVWHSGSQRDAGHYLVFVLLGVPKHAQEG
jgi:hypothetical protein